MSIFDWSVSTSYLHVRKYDEEKREREKRERKREREKGRKGERDRREMSCDAVEGGPSFCFAAAGWLKVWYYGVGTHSLSSMKSSFFVRFRFSFPLPFSSLSLSPFLSPPSSHFFFFLSLVLSGKALQERLDLSGLRFAGSSAGSLVSICLLLNVNFDRLMDFTLTCVRRCRCVREREKREREREREMKE
jgi:hypothetical protein